MEPIRGAIVLGTEPHALWEVLDAPERLGRVLPHVRDFAPGGQEGCFEAVIEPRTAVGPVPVTTTWRRTRREPPNGLSYLVSGRSEENLIDLELALDLQAHERGVSVTWDCWVSTTGVLRSVSQRVLVGIVAHQVRLALTAAADEAR